MSEYFQVEPAADAAAIDPLLDRQPGRAESFFAMTKSLIIRALIIYFITSFFRRPQTTPPPQNPNDPDVKTQAPAWNLFENGTMFDMYFYVSEEYHFKQFNDPQALVWYQDGLICE